MKKTTPTYYCDLCGKEVTEHELTNIETLTYRTTNDDIGIGKKLSDAVLRYKVVSLDLCRPCLRKIAVVRNVNFVYDKYEIDPISNYEK